MIINTVITSIALINLGVYMFYVAYTGPMHHGGWTKKNTQWFLLSMLWGIATFLGLIFAPAAEKIVDFL